jgi:coenzyme PQQ precursor peptide PqqA
MFSSSGQGDRPQFGGTIMKTWTKPAVREQEVGLEVTSYLPAEIDVI